MITWKNKDCFTAVKACQGGPQDELQNLGLSHPDSCQVFERVLQVWP